ncbi:MAG: HAD hydrolase-like protein [Saccharofermentanales bacterium]|jgi:phosphoglycolate phosphatase-like HAD superfamily hydrolase
MKPVKKKKSRIDLKAIRILGVDKDRVVYVGDTVIDMQTAKNAEVCGIGVTTGLYDEKKLDRSRSFSGVARGKQDS